MRRNALYAVSHIIVINESIALAVVKGIFQRTLTVAEVRHVEPRVLIGISNADIEQEMPFLEFVG